MSMKGILVVLTAAVANLCVGSATRADGWFYDSSRRGYVYVQQVWVQDPFTGDLSVTNQAVAFRPGLPPVPYYGSSNLRGFAIDSSEELARRANKYASEATGAFRSAFGLMASRFQDQADGYRWGAPLIMVPRVDP